CSTPWRRPWRRMALRRTGRRGHPAPNRPTRPAGWTGRRRYPEIPGRQPGWLALSGAVRGTAPCSSAAAVEQAAAHLEQVVQADLAVAVLVEQRAQQSAAQAALLARG